MLELMRKLEEEKLITRSERVLLNEGLHDQHRKDILIEALRDVELGVNQKFSVRRLKAIIHQNGGGEQSLRPNPPHKVVSSIQPTISLESDYKIANSPTHLQTTKLKSPSKNDVVNDNENQSVISTFTNTKSTLMKVVGSEPLYAGPGNFSICLKIAKR